MKLSRSVSRCDYFQGLPGALGKDLIQPVFDTQNVVRMNADIRSLTLSAAAGLVDHDLAVGQRKPLALGAGRQAGTRPCWLPCRCRWWKRHT